MCRGRGSRRLTRMRIRVHHLPGTSASPGPKDEPFLGACGTLARRTGWHRKRARTCCSTRTTRWTGTRGGRGAREGRGSQEQADLPVDRLRGVPLVPRDGAESFEDEDDRRVPERAFRLDQGRPRGATRPRRHLHGRGAGDDRAGRLADVGVPHSRRASRSSRAPTSRRSRGTAFRRSARCFRGSRTRGGIGEKRSCRAARIRRRSRGRPALGIERAAHDGDHRAPRSTRCVEASTRDGAARRRPEVPAADDAGVPPARRCAGCRTRSRW